MHLFIIIRIFTSFFSEKYKNIYPNLVLSLFEGIHIFLDKTDIVNIYVLQSLHEHFSGFKVLLAIWVSIFFNLSGEMSQIFGPRNETCSIPWYTEFTPGMVNWELCIRLFWCSYSFSNSSVIIGRDRSFLALFTPFFYKQFIFYPRPKNCFSFSKKLPQKIVQQLFSRWSINFYYLNIQTF